MEKLPLSITLVFAVITLLTVWFFHKAANSKKALIILLTWLFVQAVVSKTGFYTVTDTLPPRFIGALFPPLLMILGLFATRQGRHFIDGLDQEFLTLLHVIRLPVEMVLFALFLQNTVPELMTFEGANFDVLSGISAPIVYYAAFVKKKLSNSFLLVWNLVCLALLINIVVLAIFSAPFPFQRFALNQPNIALLYFPFSWLPACVVPLVLLSHLAVIRQVLTKKSQKPTLDEVAQK